ncbi:MAG: DUF4864 domain-containing protein [Alphaproteobacteria bacterium]|nr:DUF4864 domain-containing protein [Alphaproteobacteria bacterium]
MRKFFLAFCAALLWASSAHAQGIAPGDAAAIRQTIERQIDAFRADDGERAFGFADATIRAMFGDPASFMAMVRQGYGMIYRPRRFEFAQAVERPDGIAQAVEFEGLDGTSAVAVYEMRRQPDGTFRIAGVYLLKARRPSV